ncbi:MAG: glycosyltransferase [Sulfurimicrobium sp.]|jgi:glycosyltransferase involved in cell wall biosynthesis|nr:glycosyltransferase [Sulfurimicrobium sp.]MDO9189587.1 glycosyltransferase [Sulfurimicrobium sp.]MDP1703192.1 glycosyltransferase [Sulfurimicrobium sp.]MDP2198769.1 glycosyltransferase [Sulfurimicrobium sp.]MDP2964136.1 glycosyltransferase [Sulfurimicrobium sp.]
MMNAVTLRTEVHEQVEKIGSADIVVGIPSFNNANTISHVVRAVQAGLAKYFPTRRAVIVNSDGGSSDGTMEVVRNASIEDFSAILLHHRVEPISRIAFPYSGIPGKGSAFRSIFEIARTLEAKACVVVDSDLRSITPEWIELLVKPVLEDGYDYVAPLYHRHKFDGTITNSIVYPLTRALYGKRVRQPIGGDFGFSGRVAGFYLSKDVWESDVARFGIDIWMTTTAIANGFRIAQSFLGAKIHDAKDPGADLSSMLYQVVSANFDLMEEYAGVWMPVHGSEPVPTFGFQYTVGLEHVPVNTGRMLGLFREGLNNLREIWLGILGAGDFREVERLGALADDAFCFPIGLWTRVIYDYAIAFHHNKLPPEHLIKSLTPLYLGKTASFILAAANMEGAEAEAEIEKLCKAFEDNKEYLVMSWSKHKGDQT